MQVNTFHFEINFNGYQLLSILYDTAIIARSVQRDIRKWERTLGPIFNQKKTVYMKMSTSENKQTVQNR